MRRFCVPVVATVMMGGLLMLTGCAGVSAASHPFSVNPGAIVGDVTYPNQVGGHTEVQLDTDDFEIIKTVEAEATSTSILGIFASGDNGYGKLFQEALAAGADEVINIKVDTRLERILTALYVKVTTKLTGTAIRWKKS